jgi:DNA-directed RNA polymerase subunit RPC12/RpoP
LSKSKYTCNNCGTTFVGPKQGATCPQCHSSIFSTVVELGMWYMLGDWLGFWGNDDLPNKPSDSFLVDEELIDEIDIDNFNNDLDDLDLNEDDEDRLNDLDDFDEDETNFDDDFNSFDNEEY